MPARSEPTSGAPGAASAWAAWSSALPMQLTSFVGREQEIAVLRRLLESTRLLTVTGAGGSGKTRLALEVAAQVASSYADGVAWVELASLAEPEYVSTHVATALGIHEDAARSPEEAIVATLREQRRLIVLDNCEHVIDACAQLVDVLLRCCPAIGILATSREALGIGGERSWLVPTLTIPDAAERPTPAAVAAAEAVRLFVERARDILPDFAVTDANACAIARICRRVDGLPLGVELAAARVRVLTPEQIAARLDESFRVLATGGRGVLPRHRTLRAAIDWSHTLLDPAERLLLARLSVFSGGFTLESAESVCAGGTIAEADVLDLLSELVDKSLVAMQEERGAARYRLLEVVRQYASARLKEGDPAEVAWLHRHHAECFRDFAAAAEPHVIHADVAWQHRVDLEIDNCRAALVWSREHGHDGDIGLPLANALIWYWYHRHLWREGVQTLEGMLAGATGVGPAARAKALHGVGIFTLYVGDLPLADARLREAEAIWRGTPNDRWLAFTLNVRTTVALSMGRAEEAEACAEECVRVARRTGEPWDVALACAYPLMAVRVLRKDWLSADALLAESERVFRERAYAPGLGFVLDARAYVALQLGEERRAARLVDAALGETIDRPDHWLASRSMRILAALAERARQDELAATLLGAADGMLSAIGARALTSERDGVTGIEAALRARMAPAAFDAAYAAGQGKTLPAATEFARVVARQLDEEGAAPAPGVRGESARRVGERNGAVPALDVRALGALEIRADGSLIAPDAWRLAKSRELLLHLLMHPAGRTREQVGLAFWPEASAAQVKNSFHVALHQIRKAMGRTELVIFTNDRYAVNWELGVELDAMRFEDAVRAALRSDADAAPPLLQGALELYRGDFLELVGAGDWHLEHRDRLRRLYVDGMLRLGELLSRAERYAEAADVHRQLVARERLHEEGYRQLMLALARTGDRGEALRHYDRLVTLLRVELDAEPERETVALAERIRRGEHG